MREILEAVQTNDLEAIEALLAEDVRFSSPVVSRTYDGKAITAAILRAIGRVFSDVRHVRSIEGTDGQNLAFLYEATLDGEPIHGCDIVHVDESGRIDEIIEMVRPLAAAKHLSSAMGAEFRAALADAEASG